MQKVQVYDLPIRAFHWIFGVLFILSFSIGKFIDDDSFLYSYHMLSGLTMTFIVILRVFWGLIGTQYSRFSSFKLTPKDLIQYLSNILNGQTQRELGHNSASSYVAIIMFSLTIFLTTTGLLMLNGVNKRLFKEVHEVIALSFLVLVILHIMGVLFHQIRHKDGMIFSMINGRKDNIEGHSSISNQAAIPLILFLALFIGFISYLFQNFNTENQTLTIFKQTLQLGEKDNHQVINYNQKKHKK